MRVRIHEDAGAFLDAADPFIRADPFTTNVISVAAPARRPTFEGSPVAKPGIEDL